MVLTRAGCLRVLFTIAAVAIAGCGGPPTPSSSGEPSPRPGKPTVSPSPSPIPAVATVRPFRSTPRPFGAPPEESLPTSASAERDGVKLTIRLGGANPMRAGDRVLAFVTIENRGDRLLRWTNDGCDTNAWIEATMSATWRDRHAGIVPRTRAVPRPPSARGARRRPDRAAIPEGRIRRASVVWLRGPRRREGTRAGPQGHAGTRLGRLRDAAPRPSAERAGHPDGNVRAVDTAGPTERC